MQPPDCMTSLLRLEYHDLIDKVHLGLWSKLEYLVSLVPSQQAIIARRNPVARDQVVHTSSTIVSSSSSAAEPDDNQC